MLAVLGTFEERLAGGRAAEEAADAAAAAARAQAADQVKAAQAKARELEPAVEDAIATISALPLGSPYKLGVREWSYHRTEPVISDSVRTYYVYLPEQFKKPRIGKTGTVTPVGWSFSIGHYSRAGLGVKVRHDRPTTFAVSTPVLMAPAPEEHSLEGLCRVGVVRWDAGTYKDSSWEGGAAPIDDLLDTFLTVAAELVAKCRR